jgi:hypothetical protein
MALKRIELDLYIWEGLITNQPSIPQYEINKARIDTQNNITIEIGELVRDYLEITFNDDYLSQTRWVRAVVDYFNEADEPYTYSNPQVFDFVATDGYGYFEDGTNPELSRNVLISADNIYLPENTASKIPIFAEGVGKVIIDSTTTDIINNNGQCRGNDGSYTDDNCQNTAHKILYITVPQNSSTIQVYDTDDTTLLKTIRVTNQCEPKYTPYKITFLNKYGAFQDLYAFKKSVEETNVKDETFKRNTVSNNTSTYQTYEGQKQRYNVNSNSSITLNTGFIKEDMNATIEELFFTENVWIRYEGKTLPVIPSTKSMQYKTVLNDKLINYTIKLDFAFDKINNVR